MGTPSHFLSSWRTSSWTSRLSPTSKRPRAGACDRSGLPFSIRCQKASILEKTTAIGVSIFAALPPRAASSMPLTRLSTLIGGSMPSASGRAVPGAALSRAPGICNGSSSRMMPSALVR